MEDIYKIGISLSLKGSVAEVVEKLIKQFNTLDKAINTTDKSLSKLIDGMRALNREAKGAADSLKGAASAMEQAAKSSARYNAGGATGFGNRSSGGAGQSAAGSAIAGYRPRPYEDGRVYTGEVLSPGRMPRGPRRLPPAPPAIDSYNIGDGTMVPYWNRNTGFTTQGDPYFPYGSGIPGGRQRPSGGALIPYRGGSGGGEGGGGGGGGGGGFTMHGSPYDSHGGPVGPYNPSGPRQRPLAANGYDDELRIPNGRGGGHGDPFVAGVGALGGYEALKFVWGQTADKDAMLARLVSQGFTPDEAQRLYKLADQTRVTTPGSGIISNLQIASDLMTVTQDKQAALQLMPAYAKLGVTLGGFGQGGQYEQVMAAIQAGEFRGVLTKKDKDGKDVLDTAALTSFVNEVVSADVASGGRVGPSQVLQFLRAGGVAGALINDDELFGKSLALQVAMGSSRAGRALQGFEQQFTAGRMSEASANLLIQMGVIQGGGDAKHNPYLQKSGMGQFLMLPGAMPPKEFEQAYGAPYAFTEDYLLPKFQEYLHKNYGDAYDKADPKTKLAYESAMASQIASRIPGGVSMAEVIRNILLLNRDVDALHLAGNRDVYGIQQANNPLLRTQALTAAVDAASMKFGDASIADAIKGINNLGDAINRIGDWAEKHATATNVVLESFAAAVVALGVGTPAYLALTAMGGAGGLFAAVGVGTILAMKGLQALTGYLQKTWPGTFNDNGLNDIRNHPVEIPWWMPGGHGNALSDTGWSPFHPFTLDHYRNGKWDSQGAPAAPTGASAPMEVHVTNRVQTDSRVTNPGDLAHGFASGAARPANDPPTGISGSDLRQDLGGVWGGLAPNY